ncbi:hypothetical protein [Lunatibacter salilacus]|uniref:hypothetical protein n=1 Tax=Lunatibacter salilacus TaxID=2483804 RepID=UPI00131DB79F|nr:hypothetical protein [Lunatibacter salilacus]
MKEVQELFDFLQNHLRVKSIAEELLLFKMENYRQEMADRNFQTAVIQTPEGLLKIDLGDTKPTRISPDEIFSPDIPLFEVFPFIASNRRVFIGIDSNISHIATRSDLDKIPVRLGLFGLISVLESVIKELVRTSLPQWEESLSKERLDSARKLYQLKTSRSEEIDLIQCLQLGDLGSIFSKSKRYKLFDPSLSRKSFDDKIRNIGKLRDALAHSQDILPFDWSEISMMIGFIRDILKNKQPIISSE